MIEEPSAPPPDAAHAPIEVDPEGAKPRERWFVPFVIVPLGIAVALLAIIGGANFLLGRFEPGSITRYLDEIQTGGANTKKQAAFHLARHLNELVAERNREIAGGDRAAAGRPALPRADLTKIERGYELAKNDLETRHFLIDCLGLVGDEETVAFLSRQLTSPDEPDADGSRRVWILGALARIGSPAATPVFRAELESVKRGESDAGVANVLAAAFGNLPGRDGTAGLLELMALAQARASSGSGEPGPGTSTGTRWELVPWTAAVNLAKRHAIDAEAARLAEPVLLAGLEQLHGDAFRPDREKVFRGGAQTGLPFGKATPRDDAYRESAAAQMIEALKLLKVRAATPLLTKISTDDPNLRIRSAALSALEAFKA